MAAHMTKKKLATLTAYAAAAILAAVQWSTGTLANGQGATATAAALIGLVLTLFPKAPRQGKR
jgi:hypothetical protein